MTTKLTSLYRRMQRENIALGDYDMTGSEAKAAVIRMGDDYMIFADYGRLSGESEELRVLYHEYGHIKTGTTHTITSPYDLVCRHEYRADRYSIQRIIGIGELKKAINGGKTEIWQLAEHFDQPEWFIERTLDIYKRMGKI